MWPSIWQDHHTVSSTSAIYYSAFSAGDYTVYSASDIYYCAFSGYYTYYNTTYTVSSAFDLTTRLAKDASSATTFRTGSNVDNAIMYHCSSASRPQVACV